MSENQKAVVLDPESVGQASVTPSVDTRVDVVEESDEWDIQFVGMDGGFGHFKVVGNDSTGKTVKLFKFPSSVANAKVDSTFTDDRVIKMAGQKYYVGTDALAMPSKSIQDIVTYDQLHAYLPLLMHRALSDLGCSGTRVPKCIVLGLSIAHIKKSKAFKERAEQYIASLGWTGKCEIRILPQGAGVKLAVDKYFVDYPKTDNAILVQSADYMIADVGMNTLDVLMVTGGKVTAGQVRGLENRGAIVICKWLYDVVKDETGRALGIKELNDVLNTGFLKIRGKTHDFRDACEKFKLQYLKDLEVVMESEFGDVMDKVDFILIAGGGAYFFGDTITSGNGFYRAPKNHAEFYNALGFAVRAAD